MHLITVSGPPSVGKTSVVTKTSRILQEEGLKVGTVKYDCIATFDDAVYERFGIPIQIGLSGGTCPDHFFVSNIEDCVAWGKSLQLDVLVSESAGICNRCSPHIAGILGICVVDCLSGIHAPAKMGAMLHKADVIVITKSDIVSPAERDVFLFLIRREAPSAVVLFVNGITGQGARELSWLFKTAPTTDQLCGYHLRFSPPAAICSFCLGQTSLDTSHQVGNLHRISLE